MDICVVGSGIIGLSTAVAIQERVSSPTKGIRVTVLADRFDQHTVSHGSGGHVCPIVPPGIPDDVGRQWCKDSEDHFNKLAMSGHASESGVSLIGGFQLVDDETNPSVQKILGSFSNVKEMEPKDLKMFGKHIKKGYTATSVIVEVPIYLKWLMAKFTAKGGRVVKRHLKSLHELSGEFDIVVNCTGLGSRTLVNDSSVCPVRGQVVHVKAPWIKTFVRVDAYVHIFPLRDSVFVGSVKQESDDVTISAADSEQILTRAQECYPPLKGAQVLWEWAGLRPQRDPLRLEQETIRAGGKTLKVVHNYGHGSFGIALSWGTAIEVSKLVENFVRESRRKPSAKL